MTKNKLYVLEYGNRRLESAKKLGWKKIKAHVDADHFEEIPVDSIDILDNVRIKIKEDDLGELMQDMKQRGLLQPIGVISKEKYDSKDFAFNNIAENIHRKDITPIELGIMCKRLKNEHGLSANEMAVRLSVPLSRIETALQLEATVPEEYKEKLTYKGRTGKEGGISATIAGAISNLRINKAETKKLYNLANKENITSSQLREISSFIKSGFPVERAIELSDQYVPVAFVLNVDKDLIKKIEGSMTKHIKKVLIGEASLFRKGQIL